MKTLLLTLTFITVAVTVQAQSVSVSPTSFLAWGRSGSTALAEIEYKNVSLIYLHALKDDVDYEGNRYHGGFVGIFYTPITIGKDLYSKGSVGIFHRQFPTEIGQRLHFRFHSQ